MASKSGKLLQYINYSECAGGRAERRELVR